MTLFFRCISCCNCLFLILLTALVLLEMEKVHTLQTTIDKDQATIAALQEEVREKQDVKIEALHQEVEQEHNLTFLTLAGFFTLLTCLISMFHMSSHLQKMNQPIIQRKILAIIWMSPIYSVTSFMTLLFPPMEGYMAIIKDFYESYCIYTFLSFLIVVLGQGSRESAVEVLALRAHHLQEPTKLLSRWYDPPPETSDLAKAHAVITECQIFAMQFVFIRPLTTVMYVVYMALQDDEDVTTGTLVTEDSGSNRHRFLRLLMTNTTDSSWAGTLAPTIAPLFSPTITPVMDQFTPAPTIAPISDQDFTEATKEYFQSFSFVLTMIVNVSVFFAFMGLLKFYHSVQNDLAWCRPWPKFLTIKGTLRYVSSRSNARGHQWLYSLTFLSLSNTGVVFLTFWQGLAILILVNLSGSSDDPNAESPDERGRRYQNILICCEMLFFSLTHWCVFPAEEWEKGYEPPTQAHQPGIGIQDFVSDVGQIYHRRRKRRASANKRSSPRRGDHGHYHKPGSPETFIAGAEEAEMHSEVYSEGTSSQKTEYRHSTRTGTIQQDQDSSESYHGDMDLQLEEEPVALRPLPVGQPNRVRLFSDGSSVNADDEDDDMELL